MGRFDPQGRALGQFGGFALEGKPPSCRISRGSRKQRGETRRRREMQWAARINAALEVPPTWRLLGYFCLGYAQTENDSPELEREGWEHRHAAEAFIVRR